MLEILPRKCHFNAQNSFARNYKFQASLIGKRWIKMYFYKAINQEKNWNPQAHLHSLHFANHVSFSVLYLKAKEGAFIFLQIFWPQKKMIIKYITCLSMRMKSSNLIILLSFIFWESFLNTFINSLSVSCMRLSILQWILH